MSLGTPENSAIQKWSIIIIIVLIYEWLQNFETKEGSDVGSSKKPEQQIRQ